MRTQPRSFHACLAATAFAAAGLTACVSAEDEADQIASAIEEENGGLDMEDEAPMFGADEAYATASMEADTTLADPFATDTTVAQMIELPDALAASVAILWGQLPPDPEPEASAVVWSGTMSVNRGAIIVRRAVGFEEATDRILPRTDRTAVSFDSVTRPFVDGLLLTVVDPDPTNAEPFTLTYTRNDGASRSVELADLLAGPYIENVDDQGNRMIAHALRRQADPCDYGFARGRWHALREGLGGLLGVVSDEDGTPIGHIRGHWGIRRNGEHVFFGKYIDRDGHFRGIFGGHYRDGEMVGRWMTRAGEFGRLHGEYEESAPGPRVGGHFALRWAETSCARDLPTDEE